MYARVVVDTGATSSIESLTYEIPDGLAEIGSSVLVPLGPRQAVGYVIGFDEAPPLDKIKSAIGVVESPVRLSDDLLRLAKWISARYMCSLSRSVAAILPAVMISRVQGRIILNGLPDVKSNPTPAECRIITKICAARNGISLDSLAEEFDKSALARVLRQLEEKGVAKREWRLIPPSGKPRVVRGVRLASGVNVDEASVTPKRKEALKLIAGLPGSVTVSELTQRYGVSPNIISGLEKAGVLESIGIPMRRAPAFFEREQVPIQLTDEQQTAIRAICESIDGAASFARKAALPHTVIPNECEESAFHAPEKAHFSQAHKKTPVSGKGFPETTGLIFFNTQPRATGSDARNDMNSASYVGHLLFGVTASGKTEVYLRCIEHALSLGKTALVLLPEIALTTQVMNIFRSRLGDRVAVLHSGLSDGERCDEWIRAQSGEARVVLGARSAVFAPLSNLGIVVVDEEHESSYKQDSPPRYNCRDVAAYRARKAGCALVLGSATPSIETFHAAQEGRYNVLTLTRRVEDRPMPAVHVVDLREEWALGKVTIFSACLEEAIRERLGRGEQVMLLQNRRAYSTFLLCRECGLVMRCPNCAVSLRFHSAQRKLSCHHCDFAQPAPTLCPDCGGRKLKGFGIGTERVEEEAKRLFPEARIIRMDRDTTSRRGAHGAILEAFRKGHAEIMVGTQMISKGLDFPNVTLVGVISADTSLNLPDFRAGERTFQLLTQVAGRSGRGSAPGEVIIQTFDPEHYAIKCALNHDYIGFHEQELAMRRELSYPPFTSLVSVYSHDPEERTAESRLRELVRELKSSSLVDRKEIKINGPVPAVIPRLRGEYRWHLLLRSKRLETAIKALREVFDRKPALARHLAVDVDPMSMV